MSTVDNLSAQVKWNNQIASSCGQLSLVWGGTRTKKVVLHMTRPILTAAAEAIILLIFRDLRSSN